MAETVYLVDGSMEVVLDEEDIFLERLLREKLGDDAARFFSNYVNAIKEEAEYAEKAQQDAERLVSDYLALCQGALGALGKLKGIVHEEHLDRTKIQKIVDGAYKKLYHNL